MALPSQEIRKPKVRRKINKSKKRSKIAIRLAQLQKAKATASAAAVQDLLGLGELQEGTSDSILDIIANSTSPNNEYQLYQQTNEANWTDDDEEDVYCTFEDRTKREQENWKKVIPLMFPEYMKCSKKTFQWGDEALSNHNWKSPCNCSNGRERMVDVVDILYRKKIQVRFCSCQMDCVRLVQIGFIAGSPKTPVTAFSIRLLRFHHILWKMCRVRIDPFCRAIDEYLDGKNPPILSAGGDRTREWRNPFSAAVDAYRQMLNMEVDLKTKALKLTAREQLASNCPRCFGPTFKGKRELEPDVIVCLDGNFQHRRHTTASAAWRDTPKEPSLFLPQVDIDHWQDQVNQPDKSAKEKKDPCTASHTAADDARGHQTWRGCDETGLFGMACRHDHVLKFINIVKSGERNHFPIAMIDWLIQQCQSEEELKWKFAILYDIGCNLEKGIKKRHLFNALTQDGRLMFGTGAWHSYAHI